MNDAQRRPGAGLAVAKSRSAMLRRAREFFESRDILEVDTPILSRYPVTDPNIASISASSLLQPELFLHTSPEYKMKQLLAAGFGDIYQIAKVFRDGESGTRHLPEFTLVEWYRKGFGLQQIIGDTVEFISKVLDRGDLPATTGLASYEDAFLRVTGLDPHGANPDQLADYLNADAKLRRSIGGDRDAWLDLVLADRIVPEFPKDQLTVIYHYPKSQAALAKICDDNANCADRFEVFCGTVELANGFVELIDADEQLARFNRDQEIRRARGLPVHGIDEDLIDALRAGLPPCAGVAVGFDRLLMLYQKETDIANITSFSSLS